MNRTPTRLSCSGPRVKLNIACHTNPNTGEILNCTECIHSLRTNIPESKQKFLRDMIFSTGDFDEE